MPVLCGRNCSFEVDNSSYISHMFTLNMAGVETDVTAFGSGKFGDYVVCSVNGTVNASFYDNVVSAISIGDEVDLDLELGYDAPVVLSFTDAVVQSVTATVDAKGIAGFDVIFRLTGDMSVEVGSDASSQSA